MNQYIVHNDEGRIEYLEVSAESELGFHVKISVPSDTAPREYRDFIPRILFETLVKTGTLETMSEARAG